MDIITICLILKTVNIKWVTNNVVINVTIQLIMTYLQSR